MLLDPTGPDSILYANTPDNSRFLATLGQVVQREGGQNPHSRIGCGWKGQSVVTVMSVIVTERYSNVNPIATSTLQSTVLYRITTGEVVSTAPTVRGFPSL